MLAGARGDLVVYVSGAAVHVLRLSTRRDSVIRLADPGPTVKLDLTTRGLFYAYNAPHTVAPAAVAGVRQNEARHVAHELRRRLRIPHRARR